MESQSNKEPKNEPDDAPMPMGRHQGRGERVKAKARNERAAFSIPHGCDPNSVLLAFPVPPEMDGQRLDRFVQWRIPRLSRTRAFEIAELCAFFPDGRKRSAYDRVHLREHVLLVRQRFVEPEAPTDFPILFQDEAILVLNKPAGLVVHPSATHHRGTLTYLLAERFGKDSYEISHRLDKETSGIVVCGTWGKDDAFLKKQFESRAVKKEYLAIVRGTMRDDSGVVSAPMRRKEATEEGDLHILMETHPEGMAAETEYRVVGRQNGLSLVHLFPRTGRQHQLRVHLAFLGHPIVGDKLYGPESSGIFREVIAQGMTDDLRNRLGHERHALHAHRLTFAHPRTLEEMTFEANMPEDMQHLWRHGLPV